MQIKRKGGGRLACFCFHVSVFLTEKNLIKNDRCHGYLIFYFALSFLLIICLLGHSKGLQEPLLVPVQWMVGWMGNHWGNDWPQNNNHLTSAMQTSNAQSTIIYRLAQWDRGNMHLQNHPSAEGWGIQWEHIVNIHNLGMMNSTEAAKSFQEPREFLEKKWRLAALISIVTRWLAGDKRFFVLFTGPWKHYVSRNLFQEKLSFVFNFPLDSIRCISYFRVVFIYFFFILWSACLFQVIQESVFLFKIRKNNFQMWPL